ncbi:hypothetical protein KFK09_026119 [Dendrobium nobile]|uniref:Uncharacterized protein n=1 Tax=Dendrobium nobile TaxID=94219 RepID=A0A8T3A6V5_DENNO|nr:hypothetical protein KFK09_026119 [Dendrobium nobile]
MRAGPSARGRYRQARGRLSGRAGDLGWRAGGARSGQGQPRQERRQPGQMRATHVRVEERWRRCFSPVCGSIGDALKERGRQGCIPWQLDGKQQAYNSLLFFGFLRANKKNSSEGKKDTFLFFSLPQCECGFSPFSIAGNRIGKGGILVMLLLRSFVEHLKFVDKLPYSCLDELGVFSAVYIDSIPHVSFFQKHVLLNSDEHANLLKKQSKDPSDYCPDIVHQALLAILDSLLTKASRLLALYVRSTHGMHSSKSNHMFAAVVRKVKNYCCRQKCEASPLIKNPVTDHLPAFVAAASDNVNLVFMVGATAHGVIDKGFIDDFISDTSVSQFTRVLDKFQITHSVQLAGAEMEDTISQLHLDYYENLKASTSMLGSKPREAVCIASCKHVPAQVGPAGSVREEPTLPRLVWLAPTYQYRLPKEPPCPQGGRKGTVACFAHKVLRFDVNLLKFPPLNPPLAFTLDASFRLPGAGPLGGKTAWAPMLGGKPREAVCTASCKHVPHLGRLGRFGRNRPSPGWCGLHRPIK